MGEPRNSPVYPPFFADVRSLALLFDGSFDAAIAVAGESLRLNQGGLTARLVLTAGYWERGGFAQAREAGKRVVRADESFSLHRFAQLQPDKNPSDLETFVSGLKAAGVPA